MLIIVWAVDRLRHPLVGRGKGTPADREAADLPGPPKKKNAAGSDLPGPSSFPAACMHQHMKKGGNWLDLELQSDYVLVAIVITKSDM